MKPIWNIRKKIASASAPATIANLAVGFDILGLCFGVLNDQVTVHISEDRNIKIDNIDAEFSLPKAAKNNTATAALISMQKNLKLPFGFRVQIKKGIPFGSGLGGSAASAVAAVVAANDLLSVPLSRQQLLPFAVDGEYAASGSYHADNVAPSLFGGLTLVQEVGTNKKNHHWRAVPLPFPSELKVIVLHPGVQLETKKARAVLPSRILLHDHILATSKLAGFMTGCFQKNLEMIGSNLDDTIIEPYRKKLIKHFSIIIDSGLCAGAIGAGLSGAGPSLFAFSHFQKSKKVAQAMLMAAKKVGYKGAQVWCGPIQNKGAQVL